MKNEKEVLFLSINKILVGTITSLLLAGGFATTASASEYIDAPIEKSVVEKSGGIRLPNDMRVGDRYEETINVNGEDVNYTVTKNDEQLGDSSSNNFSTMSALPQTVPVSGRASFTVKGEVGVNTLSFRLKTYQGLIDSVSRPQYNFIASVDLDKLTIENNRLASYRIATSLSIPWIGGPSTTQTLEGRITSPGANQNINYLEIEVY